MKFFFFFFFLLQLSNQPRNRNRKAQKKILKNWFLLCCCCWCALKRQKAVFAFPAKISSWGFRVRSHPLLPLFPLFHRFYRFRWWQSRSFSSSSSRLRKFFFLFHFPKRFIFPRTEPSWSQRRRRRRKHTSRAIKSERNNLAISCIKCVITEKSLIVGKTSFKTIERSQKFLTREALWQGRKLRIFNFFLEIPRRGLMWGDFEVEEEEEEEKRVERKASKYAWTERTQPSTGLRKIFSRIFLFKKKKGNFYFVGGLIARDVRKA